MNPGRNLKLVGLSRARLGSGVLATLLSVCAAGASAGVAADHAAVDVRLRLSSSRANGGVLLRAAIHTARGTRCSVVVLPPRHVRGLAARFTLPNLRADRHGRAHAALLLSPAAPAGRWIVKASCRDGRRHLRANSGLRLGRGGRLGGPHIGPVCKRRSPRPNCVSLNPVVQSTGPAPGGLGAAGGCRPFGTVLVPGSAWLGGHGADVISNGCTYLSYVRGQYGWKYQCVELFERLINEEGWYKGAVTAQDAQDLYPNAPASAFDKHPNGSGSVPVPGDAIVFTGGEHGHVAIVRSVSDRSVDIVEQNDMGSGTAVLSLSGSTIGNDGILRVEGVLHAKANTSTQPALVLPPSTQAPAPSANHPSAAVWPGGTRNPAGQQDVFWKGSGNNGLWEAVWNNGWHGPTPVPVNNAASAPTVVVNAPRNEEDVFWKGTDNQLWEIEWNGAWTMPHAVGMGPLGSEPSVAVWPSGRRNPPGQQDVFWKGSGNNGLWEAVWNNGWHGPSRVPAVSNVASAPTAVVNAARNEEDIFWKGTDGQLWEIEWAGGWTAPHAVGMGPLGSDPSVAVWPSGTRNPPGQQDVFWKGSGNNGLSEAAWNNGWHGPSRVPAVTNVASAPTAVVNAARNEEDIFWKGTDGQLWEIEWAGGWTAPHAVGMGPLG